MTRTARLGSGLLLTSLITFGAGTDATAQVRSQSSEQAREAEERSVLARAAESEKSRLRMFLDDAALSPMLPARLAFSAAVDQRADTPAEWDEGAKGFGKRMAGRAALNATQAGVHHATAALLRLDPRGDQTRCGCRHPLRRTAHALARTFATHDARGRSVPNVPLFAGAFGGALVASVWYPPSYRPNHEAVRVASLTIVAHAGANVAREFAPELKRLIPGARTKNGEDEDKSGR
jgi:hypothetical protein